MSLRTQIAILIALSGAVAGALADEAAKVDARTPRAPDAILNQYCNVCHLTGWNGAPLRAEALQIVADYTLGPLFTPPSVVGENGKKGVLQMPSAAGGANWGGAAFDPETGYLFLQSANIVSLAAVVKGDATQKSAYAIRGAAGPPGPRGLPLIKPPYGAVTAIDLNKGEIAWQVAHGDGPRDHPDLKALHLPPLGASSHTFLSSGGPLVTKSLLFLNQVQTKPDLSLSATEYFMRAFDKKTGAVVWEHRMTEPPFGTPMTYLHGGRQYLVVATGGVGTPGRLVAFALPVGKSGE